MKTALKLAAILLTACAWAHAQVVPEATGPGRLPVSGNLHYSLSYSQTAAFYGGGQGEQGGNQVYSIAAGDVNYANGKDRFPFSLDYGGGYMWTISGPSYDTGIFQHLLISQGIVWRKWNVMASDNVSDMPQAPITGFSGIPGTGEPIGGTTPAPPSSQTILTQNTRTIDNIASGELGHTLNYATTLSIGGSSEVLRYPDVNGLNMNTQMANAELTRRLNARNSLAGNYIYSQFSYPDYNFSFVTNTALLDFKRTWNKKVTTDFSAGPQWTSSSNSAAVPFLGGSTGAVVPSSLGVAANASLNYQYRFDSASLSYSHGVSGGAGYVVGTTVDSVNANFSREFGKNLTVGLTGSYVRSATLQESSWVIDEEYGGVQATRRLSRYLNVFANYTAINQSSNSAPQPGLAPQLNILNQFYQVIGFGIAYSPRETHLRQ
jgi:hypothetical protein